MTLGPIIALFCIFKQSELRQFEQNVILSAKTRQIRDKYGHLEAAIAKLQADMESQTQYNSVAKDFFKKVEL